MKKLPTIKIFYLLILSLGLSVMAVSGLSSKAYAEDDSCHVTQTTILGIPTWYKYLGGNEVKQLDKTGEESGTVCQPKIWTRKGESLPKRDVLLIVAAIMEILIRVAGLAAFIYLMYGGFMYLTSSGNSESVKKAGSTLLNAAIGLAIVISATTIINYFAKQLTK
jgi:hypothetical protein